MDFNNDRVRSGTEDLWIHPLGHLGIGFALELREDLRFDHAAREAPWSRRPLSLCETECEVVAGRVISVCARAATLSDALAKAYQAAPKVRFEGARYRHDIGYRALQRKADSGTFRAVVPPTA